MRYKIILNTEDPDIIEAFNQIGQRSKAKLVEKALIFFLSTRKGRETVEIMSRRATGHIKSVSELKGQHDAEADKVLIDRFL